MTVGGGRAAAAWAEGRAGRAPLVLGWDVGGANLKAAAARPGAVRALTVPFALWERPAELAGRLGRLAGRVLRGRRPVAAGLTLTAELADVFASREEGVRAILTAARTALPGVPLHVLTVEGRFVTPGQARRRPGRVASANWAATARLVARRWPDAVLVDVGSTTADVVPVVGGAVAAAGRTDLERLRLGELVYTGVVRTPVAAIARSVPLPEGRCRLAGERFAQSGDVHLLLGRLRRGEYGGPTPDGRGKSRRRAAARLARMLCAFPGDLSPATLRGVARYLAGRQEREISAAIRQVRGRIGVDAPRLVVAAGAGAFLARAAARRAGLPVRELSRTLGREGSRAAAAAAVAILLGEERE